MSFFTSFLFIVQIKFEDIFSVLKELKKSLYQEKSDSSSFRVKLIKMFVVKETVN